MGTTFQEKHKEPDRIDRSIRQNFSMNIMTLCGKGRRYDSFNAFAQSIGVSASTVKSWVEGENFPDFTSLIKVAYTLGVSIDWLVAEHTEPDMYTFYQMPGLYSDLLAQLIEYCDREVLKGAESVRDPIAHYLLAETLRLRDNVRFGRMDEAVFNEWKASVMTDFKKRIPKSNLISVPSIIEDIIHDHPLPSKYDTMVLVADLLDQNYDDILGLWSDGHPERQQWIDQAIDFPDYAE